MNPVLRSSAAHLFVESLTPGVPPAVADADVHHLFRVLRLRNGEVVTLCDGRGGWAPFVVAGTSLAPAGDLVQEAPPRPCRIAAAIPKGDRLDWMVQKLTEIGVTEIALVHFARSVVRWEADRGQRQMERLGRIAREAASQSRRTWLPILEAPQPFVDIEPLSGAVLLDPAGEAGLDDVWSVVVGPEGGFDPREVDHGLPLRTLGPTVLRIETAAVVAAARILK